MAYEMLAGRPPFGNGSTPMAVLYAHVHNPPPPLGDLAPDTPEAVRRWVEWLLAKAPEDRPASAAEAWEALEEIAVAELGPYWRRSAAVLAPPEERTIALTAEEPTTEVPAATRTQEPPQRRRGRDGWPCSPGASRRSERGRGRGIHAAGLRPCAAPPTSAVPFDFDGDGGRSSCSACRVGAREGGAPGGGSSSSTAASGAPGPP